MCTVINTEIKKKKWSGEEWGSHKGALSHSTTHCQLQELMSITDPQQERGTLHLSQEIHSNPANEKLSSP